MVREIVIVALFSYGYCATFWSDMIFEKVGDWAERKLPKKLWLPLGGCPICNAFWVGTLMYWIFWGNVWTDWLMISISAAGFNAIFVNLINKIEDISTTLRPPENETPQ